MVIDFAISTEAIKKAERYEKRRIELNTCLQSKVCPICAGDLVTEIDGNRNTEYKCTNCDFVWPQENK
jgi:transposase-like protein